MDHRQFPCSETVVVLAAGLSGIDWVDLQYKPSWKEWEGATIWGVNNAALIYKVDACFHMHDLRGDERAEKIMVPVMSIDSFGGRAYKYPLEEVVEKYQSTYFRNSAAYIFAYAGLRGVKRLGVFGYDFNYPDRTDYEAGRCSAEYWLGVLGAQGTEVVLPRHTTLCDTQQRLTDRYPLYGYGMHQPDFDLVGDKVKVVRNGLRDIQDPG